MADNKGINNCQCEHVVQNQTQQAEEQSFAMMMLQEQTKNAKRWFVIAITILIMWLATIGAFLAYLNQYCFEGETVTVDGKEQGNAYYQTGNGVFNNGKNNGD